MKPSTHVFPCQPVPSLELPTVDGPNWSLAEQTPENFTLIVFYRGLHCPICSRYLVDLQSRLSDFIERGVTVVAVSSDDRERAEETKRRWDIPDVPLAYGLSVAQARQWGLYISASRGRTSIGVTEPEQFSEPGLFLVRPDGTLYFASVQTMPFTRPSFAEILGALDYVLKEDYPARGEVLERCGA